MYYRRKSNPEDVHPENSIQAKSLAIKLTKRKSDSYLEYKRKKEEEALVAETQVKKKLTTKIDIEALSVDNPKCEISKSATLPLRKSKVLPSTLLFMDAVQVSSEAQNRSILKAKKSRSRIPVAVHANGTSGNGVKATEKEAESSDNVVGNDADQLKSCLHVYRPIGSVNKNVRWAEGQELEKVRVFSTETGTSDSSTMRKYKSSVSLNFDLSLSVMPKPDLSPMTVLPSELEHMELALEQLHYGTEMDMETSAGRHQLGLLSESSMDLSSLGAEEEGNYRNSSEGGNSLRNQGLSKWPSGLLGEVLESCEAFHPIQKPSPTAFHKAISRRGMAEKSFEEETCSPSKRQRLSCRSTRESPKKSSPATSTIIHGAKDDGQGGVAEQVVPIVSTPRIHTPKPCYRNGPSASTPTSGNSSPASPMRDPRLARRSARSRISECYQNTVQTTESPVVKAGFQLYPVEASPSSSSGSSSPGQTPFTKPSPASGRRDARARISQCYQQVVVSRDPASKSGPATQSPVTMEAVSEAAGGNNLNVGTPPQVVPDQEAKLNDKEVMPPREQGYDKGGRCTSGSNAGNCGGNNGSFGKKGGLSIMRRLKMLAEYDLQPQ